MIFCHLRNETQLTTIYAFGDSHLSALSSQLVGAIGKRFNYLEANISDCLFVLNVSGYNKKTQEQHHCNEQINQKRYSIIQESRSIVLFGGRFPQALHGNGFDNEEGGFEGNKNFGFRSSNELTFSENVIVTLKQLISDGHQVVLVYPIPEVGTHVPKKIFEVIKGKDISDIDASFKPVTTSYEVYKQRSASTFEIFDSIQSPNIHRVYPHTLFCDGKIKGRCVTHDIDDVFYADDDHPSTKGAEMIAGLIMEQVENAEAKIKKNY
jgi:hypothetical protein